MFINLKSIQNMSLALGLSAMASFGVTTAFAESNEQCETCAKSGDKTCSKESCKKCAETAEHKCSETCEKNGHECKHKQDPKKEKKKA